MYSWGALVWRSGWFLCFLSSSSLLGWHRTRKRRGVWAPVQSWGECTKRCLFRFCSCVWIILFSSLSMSAMQVLVQEKKVHYQQIVLTSKGPQHHTHLTSSFPTEAERSLFLVYLSLKNVPWIGLFWFKIWKNSGAIVNHYKARSNIFVNVLITSRSSEITWHPFCMWYISLFCLFFKNVTS